MSNTKDALNTAPWETKKLRPVDQMAEVFVWFNYNKKTIKQALETQVKVDDGVSVIAGADFLTLRKMASQLSGLPMYAVTFDEHIEAIINKTLQDTAIKENE